MMIWRLSKAACAAAVLALSTTSLSAAEPMGEVVAVDGRPLAVGPGGSRSLETGSDVFEGDTITVSSGNAQIRLDDDTRLVVGPSSRLVLQSYLRRNSKSAKKVGLKALRGTFRVITGKSPKDAYKISTNNATIGIRGTGFDFTVDNRTVLAVLQGAVRLAGNNGQVVNTKSGCGVAEAGGKVKARELDGDEKADALNNELPFITDQSTLGSGFQLPVANCFASLGSNEGSNPGLQPQQLLPVIPALTIPAVIILLNDDKPVSDSRPPPCNPLTQQCP